MLYGWTGKRLVVDLTQGQSRVEAIPEHWRQEYLGGRGVNSRTLYDEVKPGIDPLGPENVLLFGVGPVNGTLVPGSGRYTVTALSPLTLVGEGQFPCFGDSNAGGFWGPELKFAGYDQLVIRGRAEKPVYLFISDQGVEIGSAEGIWGGSPRRFPGCGEGRFPHQKLCGFEGQEGGRGSPGRGIRA